MKYSFGWTLGSMFIPIIWFYRPWVGLAEIRRKIFAKRFNIAKSFDISTLFFALVGDGGGHEASNGLLLRRDIHSLFDAGYPAHPRRFERVTFALSGLARNPSPALADRCRGPTNRLNEPPRTRSSAG